MSYEYLFSQSYAKSAINLISIIAKYSYYSSENIIQCMNFISKSNKNEDYYMKKKGYRNPLKKKMTHQFDDDLIVYCNNPFSQQLTPWNGNSKLEASINLPKQQAEPILPFKNMPPEPYQPAVPHMISHHSIDASGLSIRHSKQQQKQVRNRYTCPKLKISSQSVIMSKDKKEQVKRLLFHKKSLNDNKKTQKIAKLLIEWDQDIIYNPEKKYFDEQYLKRKIIRQFSQSRNESRHSNSRKNNRGQQKTFKLQFKNNRIHRKQVAVFEIKRFQKSLSLTKNNSKNEKNKQTSVFIPTSQQKESKEIKNQVRVSNLSFQPNLQNADSSRQEMPNLYEKTRAQNSAKWRFRTTLRSKDVSLGKAGSKNTSRVESSDKNKSKRDQININQQSEVLNRITLQVNERVQQNWAPFQIMARTTPDFFKKTIE